MLRVNDTAVYTFSIHIFYITHNNEKIKRIVSPFVGLRCE